MPSIKLSTDRLDGLTEKESPTLAGPLDIPTYGLQTDRYEFCPTAITHDLRKEERKLGP